MKNLKQVIKVKDKIKEEFEMNSWWRGIVIQYDEQDSFSLVVRVSSDAPKQQLNSKIRDLKDGVVVMIEERYHGVMYFIEGE